MPVDSRYLNPHRLQKWNVETQAATALDLIKQLNRKLRGWANSQRHLVSSRAFWHVDKRIFEALWQWAKRRHPKKGKGWCATNTSASNPPNLGPFTAPLRKRGGTWGSLDLFRVSSVPIRRHVKIQAEATELDPAYWEYFRQRWLKKKQGRLHLRARRKKLTAMERVNPDNPTAGSRDRPNERLEPYAGKLACTVLRGAGGP
ncbi:MAG TPA: group II intron maturase-specific domain-containing protein [Thermoanaerobaculia bacterium]|nr:group II intron maturase-specific domain-containing protein [Thermoanaerobaculia bacterium]